MNASGIHLTTITIDVEVLYTVFPEADGFPPQIDINRINVITTNPVTGEPRHVNVANALTEGQIMLLEDEIQEKENETDQEDRD